jgi:hypothetical protein
MVQKPSFGDLNSAEHSQDPESLEPENLTGIDLIKKNNSDATKPRIIKKILGPFKGVVFKAGPEDPTEQQTKDEGGFFNLFKKNLVKHRILIPELHSHLPSIGEDYENVDIEIASLYPFFIAQDTKVPEVKSGTLVWCDFLDRASFKDPIYLGPVDPEAANEPPGAISTAISGFVGNIANFFAGSSGTGDPFGGVSYKNPSGQVSYPATTSSYWTGALPADGYTATTATVADLITLAKQQIGKKEIPINSDGGPEVDPFNGGRREAWCAASLAWLFRQIGAPLPGDKIPSPGSNGANPNHSVTYIKETAQRLGNFFNEPRPGDMVIYNTSGNPSLVNSNGHIGLVTEVEGEFIYTVEFNWGAQVVRTKIKWRTDLPNGKVLIYQQKKGDPNSFSTYAISDYIISGFARRPLPYSGVPDGKLVTQPVQSTRFSGTNQGPGQYEIVTLGNSEGFVQMDYIEGTTILYPTDYMPALRAMRDAYRTATGQTLGVVSGYRDVALQASLYQQYLARNRQPPQVAPPGFSLHNNGRAVDLGTGQPHDGNYERDSVPKPSKELAESWAKQGRYGPVAKWLVENSLNYGYVWAGYSFRELWHYELDVNLARQKGLIR